MGGRKRYVIGQVGLSADVYGRKHEGFVHRQQNIGVAANAAFVAQRLRKGLPQQNADILHGVMKVHMNIALGTDVHFKTRMVLKQLQHMGQKPDRRSDFSFFPAVQTERNEICVSVVLRTCSLCLMNTVPPLTSIAARRFLFVAHGDADVVLQKRRC